CQHYDSTPCSF
nr:immunoglobulin light chain junction region [Macaca mulatta]